MRLVYMGSPAEVIAPLQQLLSEAKGHGHEVVAVVSQPAKPAGRKMVLTDPPLAAFAKEQGITCLQPLKASDPVFLDELRALKPDVIITAAYGQILTNAFLSIPSRATINIHPSMLPKYRGATPVPAALLDGLTETGVSILFTVKALDAGNIILQKSFAIDPRETAHDLTARMFHVSGPLLLEALDQLKNLSFSGNPQNEADVTFCKKIAKTDGAIDWTKSAAVLSNEFRAFQPWPGVYTERQSVRIVLEDISLAESEKSLAPGEFYFDKKQKALLVGTADGHIAVGRLKSAGSKSMDAAGFWNGLKAQGHQNFEVKIKAPA
ncbi:MAG: methionyl-tRNA formyltransferase [Bdellovibrionota bacterium]